MNSTVIEMNCHIYLGNYSKRKTLSFLDYLLKHFNSASFIELKNLLF